MRPIKFRAWNKKAKRIMMDVQTMYDGIGQYFDNHSKEIDVYSDGWYSSSFEAYLNDKNFVLMQFTSLKDKKGKEIYEGDIVLGKNTDWDEPFTAVVEWDNRMSGWEPLNYFSTNGANNLEDAFYDRDNCEVIGNIYENPKLLKK